MRAPPVGPPVHCGAPSLPSTPFPPETDRPGRSPFHHLSVTDLPLDPLRILPEVSRILAGPVVIADPEGRIRHVNPAFESLTGWSAEEARDESLVDFLVAEPDRPGFPDLLGRVLRRETTEPVEVRIRCRDDTVRTVVWSYTVVDGEKGAPVAILAAGTDLTDLHGLLDRAEALEASEARFSGIVGIASDAIISIDGEHRIVLFNHGAETIFGYEASEVIGQPLDLLLPPGARAAHRAHVEGFGNSPVAARRMAQRQEISGVRKGGATFPAEASILKLTVGNERHFTVVLRDISERVRHQRGQVFLARVGEVLATSLDLDETLRSLGSLALEFLGDFCLIDVVDPDGQGVRRVDARHRTPSGAALASALLRIPLDRDRPHLMGETLSTGTPTFRARVSPADLDAVAQGSEHRALLEALRPIAWLVVPLQARGRTLGALLCMRCEGTEDGGAPRPDPEVYDERDLELAIELGLRAGLAVDNAYLFRSAERAVEARDEVMGIVSHDLGNPLQAIFIGLEAMERSRTGRSEGRPGQEEYYLTAIRRSAEVMERLIQDLLEVRRMEAGSLQLAPAPSHLGPLVDEALEMLAPLARVKAIRIDNEVPADGIGLVHVDRDRIQQVLSNLVGNAVKHTPENGHVRIWCEAHPGELHIHVTDTGQGIAPEDLDRVFDRFWRAGGGRGRGIGLGLAIARGIVRGHGGRIWAASEEGRGSTFSFSLPRPAQGQADAEGGGSPNGGEG
jgi:PAS domain S-box-containing protein